MGKRNNHRRRRLTPSLKLSREPPRINHSSGATGPTSPPETPTGSPHMARKPPQHSAVYFGYSGRPLEQDPNIKPVGHGHQFSYRRVIGPEQLSPRSSSSDESEGEEEQAGEELDDDSSVSDIARPQSIINSTAASSEDASSGPDNETSGDGDDEDDEDADDEDRGVGEEDYEEEAGEEEEHVEVNARPFFRLPSEPETVSISAAGSEAGDEAARQSRVAAVPSSAASGCEFTVEDIDPMDSGCEGLEVLLPTEIESNRSRSRSRHKYFDKGMVRDFKNLNCSNDVSENEVDAEGELGMDTESVFLKRQKEIRRNRRVSMSSTGKRTHSEFSEFTDSDNSDTGGLDVNEVGSSARKLRKRLHRGSLLFQDPPAPRIDELDEPDSSENEYDAADPLARELPYWTMEIMEVESP